MQFITNNLFKKSTLGFFIFWTNLTLKIILQSLPKRKRKWINLTWTFKAAPSVNQCFKSIKCKPQHYKKIFKKKKKSTKKFFHYFCLMYYYFYSYLLLCLYTKKVREKRFLIANTQSMQTAKKLYFILGSRQRNTCVFTLVSSFTV